jgi:hypothetical protein
MSEKLIKINDSEKTLKDSQKVLPNTFSHTDGVETAAGGTGCGEKAGKHKWKIIAFVLVLVIALVLGITMTEDEDKPKPDPNPPPVPPPIPPN